MPNLKDIRRRIRSVKSTEKITQAMRMVAAAKVKRAENRVKASRPYANALRALFTQVYQGLQDQNLQGSRYQALLAPRPVKSVGIVVISSDRGLCGAYNSNVVRQAFKVERELKALGITPKFYLVGNKVIQAFKRYGASDVLGQLGGMTAAPDVHNANSITDTLVKAFMEGEIDGIEILSTQFRSMISYKVVMTPVLPLQGVLPERVVTVTPEQGTVREVPADGASTLQPEMLFDPNPLAVLDQVTPMYLSNAVYSMLLEAAASELAARMTAMSNATRNASEMISKLTIQYNKARQASITQELLEVVSGAQALK